MSPWTDKFDLRKKIQFNARVNSAHFHDETGLWRITTNSGVSVTCRYFLPATGPLTVAKKLPFSGLDSFKGQVYEAATWPKENVDLHGKRVAVVGTGATGVQIIPKIASATSQLTVFQRTANYVLPGRNYAIDDIQARDIRKKFDATWEYANGHPYGLAMVPSGKTLKDFSNPDELRQVLDAGWESGGFHFQFETLDDISLSMDSNKVASNYVREKIRAIVKKPETAELLCPKHPIGSKRPPCGHFYYEAFNKPNVNLVDISQDSLSIYENGIRLGSGAKHEFDIIIFALGFDAATGALTDMDIRGSEGRSLTELWASRLETYAGVLVPGFPNMFSICGPHVPFGNMPVVSSFQVGWIGKTLVHMEKNQIAKIEATPAAVENWLQHVQTVFEMTLYAQTAKDAGAWFVGANIPGKASNVLFYFGGLNKWVEWLNKESDDGWPSAKFTRRANDERAEGREISDAFNPKLAAKVKLMA